MFGYNKFKAEMINELMAAGTTTTVYRVGNFVDLCRGPHIPTYAVTPACSSPLCANLSTPPLLIVMPGRSKSIVAMECTKLGAAYWRGNVRRQIMPSCWCYIVEKHLLD